MGETYALFDLRRAWVDLHGRRTSGKVLLDRRAYGQLPQQIRHLGRLIGGSRFQVSRRGRQPAAMS